MSDKVQIIHIANTLRAKVGGKFGAFDQDAIDRAEAALVELSYQFDDWLLEEIKKLEYYHDLIKQEGINCDNAQRLYFCCHDLKGLGTTYGYPIISRIAASLCKMFDDPDQRLLAPKLLIDAHLDAIKAAVRHKIKDANHPIETTLVVTLEDQVQFHMHSLAV
jgi:hypothetical protein